MNRRPLAALALLIPVLLSGCTATIALTPAPHATDKACADVSVHLPTTVSGQVQRDTNAQATSAWGNPTSVILYCGVAVPSPTATLPCVQVGSVYWLRDDLGKNLYSFTTYGRDPAIQVQINRATVVPGPALDDLETAVTYAKATGHVCSDVEDSLNPDTVATPTPTPAPTATN
ncbi:DUF3515 domain-containing protein [soil metagenome]